MQPLVYLKSPFHSLRFALRRKLRWQRGQPQLEQEDKANLFAYLSHPSSLQAAQQRHRQLFTDYHLTPLYKHSTQRIYRDNLYVLESLQRLWREDLNLANFHPPEQMLRALDIGSRNWDYVWGLSTFLHHGPTANKKVELHGIEVDAYGIYPNLYSRFDYAKAYMAQAQKDMQEMSSEAHLHYHPCDFLQQKLPTMDIIFLLFPFFTQSPLLKWGLPAKYFRPDKILDKALKLLRPGGILIIFNQSLAEKYFFQNYLTTTQKRLKIKMQILTNISLHSHLISYQDQIKQRQAMLLQKKSD